MVGVEEIILINCLYVESSRTYFCRVSAVVREERSKRVIPSDTENFNSEVNDGK